MKMTFNRKYIKNIIAGALIVSVAFADASLLNITSFEKTRQIENEHTDSDSEFDCKIIENHLMETAMADGKFEDENSDSENGTGDTVELKKGKQLFNILEILPTERRGVVGYTIGGCEPFADFSVDSEGNPTPKPVKGIKSGDEYLVTPQEMREAYMDALFNPEPGSQDSLSGDLKTQMYNNIVNNYPLGKLAIKSLNDGFSDSGDTAPIGYVAGTYNGYYLKVGGNKGVYCIDDPNTASQKIYSRFYKKGRSDYNYIFVESDVISTRKDSDGKYIDVNVKNQKRLKYVNNEKFLQDCMGMTMDEALEWKKDHVVEVVTKTPTSVSLSDIERADVIFLNGGKDKTYYDTALKIYNLMHDYGEDDDASKSFSSKLDFDSFEKVIRIYERIVVRQDAAIIVSKECSASANNGVDTNIHKLICMLFYATKEYDSTPGAGRDVFMNFLKRYVDEPGKEYMALRKLYDDNRNNPETYIAVRRKGTNGNVTVTNETKYTDYRAPSIRHNDYYNGIPYHHYYTFNPGHPLVLDKKEAITGGYYNDDGILVPEHVDSKVKGRTMIRRTEQMYIDAGIDEKGKDEEGNYVKEPELDSDGNVIPVYYYEEGHGVRPWCVDAYQSMSNTTDYIYIDEKTGDLIRTDKYSGYWFNMDADDGNEGNAYKKITWYYDKFNVWPWGYEKYNAQSNVGTSDARTYYDYPANIWFYNISTTGLKDGFKGDLHIWFDYYEWPYTSFGKVRMIKEVGDSAEYYNQCICKENDIFKGNLIGDAISWRRIAREETDEAHVADKVTKSYYLSMNILNGDGVNAKATPGSNNKTLYYNQYEASDIDEYEKNNHKAKIPIKIRIRSSCKIKDIKVSSDSGKSVTYSFEREVGPNSLTGTGGKGFVIDRPTWNIGADGLPTKKDGTFDLTGTDDPIYTYEGSIFDVVYDDWYEGRTNTKIMVEMTAYLPDDTTKSINDTLTIVKRDFFMLN